MGGLLRKLSFAIFLMGSSFYIAAPFWTAWSIREAVKTGDVATLEDKVVWASVRQSLRQSIAHHAQLMPAAVDAGRQLRPTVWQRVKAMFGESMLDRFMDRYITAAGLPKLYQLKHGYRSRVQGLPDERLLPIEQRAVRLLRRVKRAEFKSMSHVEVEIEDRDQPDRHIVATMELFGFTWKLTSVIIKPAPVNDNELALEKVSLTANDEDEEAKQYADDLKHGRLLLQGRTGI